MRNNLEELPQLPECPKLRSLMLRDDESLKAIPQFHFFECMHSSLRELDLSRTRIESLPHSLSNLMILHVLLLKSCLELNKP
ncbi:hypothetical protein AMTRI_Chr11g156890 [Amborella trichopoda]